jgi:3-deoxy-D-manno-octulosonate 8-phosphate phosphatase (KDO 8-P phosphatase)
MNPNQATMSLTSSAMQRRVAVDPAVRAGRIELLVLDVDGVLTDGGLYYSDDGHEFKRYHVRDGLGIKLWQSLGYRVATLSGRTSPGAERRARELGIETVLQGHDDKRAAFTELLTSFRLDADQVCVVGDDLPDLPIMQRAGLSATVADAAAEVRVLANYTSAMPGGRGAVREIIEWLLKLRGDWANVLNRYQ